MRINLDYDLEDVIKRMQRVEVGDAIDAKRHRLTVDHEPLLPYPCAASTIHG
jgi:hypothetical protein